MDRFTKVKHIWSRMGFGIGPNNYIRARDGSVADTIDFFLNGVPCQPLPVPPQRSKGINPEMLATMTATEKSELRKTDDQRLNDFRNQWLDSMANNLDSVLSEKVALFWHSHLACICRGSKVGASYANTLRTLALGNYRDLLLAIAREPAMIRFLNNQQNRKGNPNENFARELLELFTLGEGNYTERDIREASRAFTGWSSTAQGEYIFRARQHDFGDKRFLGEMGPFDGEDIIDIVLSKRATASSMARKIYTYFVSENENESHIAQLADVIFESNYEMKQAFAHLLTSDWFYAENSVGNRIKSPVELLVQSSHVFQANFAGARNQMFLQRSLGQLLFNPPNVAGWPGGRSWINNATLMIRLNLPSYMIRGSRLDHAVSPSLKDEGPRKPLQYLNVECDLEKFLSYFRSIPYQDLEESLKETLLISAKGPRLVSNPREYRQSQYLERLLLRITSLPEFQLG